MGVFLTIIAIVVILYAAEDFFITSRKGDARYIDRLDQITTLLFAIALLLLAAVIKYVC